MTPVAVVTGASRGIGAAVLQRLHEDGYECVVVGRSGSEKAAAFMKHDLSDTAQATSAAEEVREYLRSRRVAASVLINNAGGAFPVAAADMTTDQVQRDITLNLVAPMLLATAALEGMRAARSGAIVNVSSIAGRTGVAFLPAYSAAKAGLIAYTHSLAAEYARDGVRVNCVCPGAVETTSAREGRRELSRRHGLDSDAYEQTMANRVGIGRLLHPSEVAEVVHWLAVGESRAINGQAINVCGTLTMG